MPAKTSLFGALFSSSVGLALILLIYAANIYAGFEIAVVRSRPIGMVVGVAAVLPDVGVLTLFAVVLCGLALRAYARTVYSPG